MLALEVCKEIDRTGNEKGPLTYRIVGVEGVTVVISTLEAYRA